MSAGLWHWLCSRRRVTSCWCKQKNWFSGPENQSDVGVREVGVKSVVLYTGTLMGGKILQKERVHGPQLVLQDLLPVIGNTSLSSTTSTISFSDGTHRFFFFLPLFGRTLPLFFFSLWVICSHMIVNVLFQPPTPLGSLEVLWIISLTSLSHLHPTDVVLQETLLISVDDWFSRPGLFGPTRFCTVY